MRGRKENKKKETKRVHGGKATTITYSVFSQVVAHLGRRSILLNRWRQGAGVGVAVGGWRFHIVVAEAAEECAEDAPAPLLL